MDWQLLLIAFGIGLAYLLLLAGALVLVLPGRLQPDTARALGLGRHVEALLLLSFLTTVYMAGIGNVPVWIDENGVVAFSLVGAIVPSLLSLNFLLRAGWVRGLLALPGIVLVAAAAYATSAPQEEMGIVSTFPNFMLPPLVAAAWAVILAPRRLVAVPLAYAIGVLGVLIGADLVRFEWVVRTEKAVAGSFGGAEILDLVFLAGLWAAAFAALPLAGFWGRLNRGMPHWGRVTILHAEGRVREALTEATRLVAQALPGWARAHGLEDLPAHELRRRAGAEPVFAQVEAAVRLGPGMTARVTAPIIENLEAVHRRLTRPRLPPPAPMGERVAAGALDLLVPLALAVVALVAAAPLDPPTASLVFFALSVFITVHIVYGFLADAFLGGATLGKWILGLRVRRLDGRPPRLWDALVRNLARLLDLPMLYLVGFAAPADAGHQRLGDYFAETVVSPVRANSTYNPVMTTPAPIPVQATQGTAATSRPPR